MTIKRMPIFALPALATFVALAVPGSILGRSISLDLRSPDAPARQVLRRGADVQRASNGETDPSLLRSSSLAPGSADVGAVETGDRLDLRLFDDSSLTITLYEKTPSALGGDTFLAEVSGYEGVRNAVVLRTDDGLTIDIQDSREGKVYKVLSTESGVVVQEIRPTGSGVCGCDAIEPGRLRVSAVGGSTDVSGVPTGVTTGEQSDSCVDILVAYDKKATAWAAANGGGLTNFAQVAVQKMNAALSNTGLSSSFRFRLVGVISLPVSSADVYDALYAIYDGVEGWKDLATARDQVGADIVTMLIDTGSAYGSTGVGLSLSDEAFLSVGSTAYNVCAVRSVALSHTMTHECGHNLGAGHATLQETDPGPQLYGDSAGHYFTGSDGNKYCTIMAYEKEGPGGTTIPFFSSPNHCYMGMATGDARHDNTRTIAKTWSYAKNWREQKTPMSYDIGFSPVSGTIIDGHLLVTLTPGKSGTQIRYTLDGSAPTASSPLYSEPIRLTATTTIMASTFVDGVGSLPFSATYYSHDDIGYAIGLPEYNWNLSAPSTSRFGVQTTNTVDGVAIGAEVAPGDVCVFSATMNGPAKIFWKSMESGSVRLQVMCDGEKVFGESWNGYSYQWSEHLAEIPAGTHVVEFRLEAGYLTTQYWLDDFKAYLVPAPTFVPATTENISTAAKFTGEQMVSLESSMAGAVFRYTLDGSDPNDDDAIPYDGPFFISESVRVKAVAMVPGLGKSMVAEGLYMKEDLPEAGKWTLDGAAAYEAVKRDGRMIAELFWDFPDCGWSAALEPVITDSAFTTWAAMNGIYLLADSWGDKPSPGGGRFSRLYWQTTLSSEMGDYIYYPTFVFASADNPDSCLGALLARNDDVHAVNSLYYEDSVESLIALFVSFLGTGKHLDPPVPSAMDANGRTFPFSVTLSNPNDTGKIYYTLDGSEPTRENGQPYSGAISIQVPGTTLKAVVWPSSATGVSSMPLVIKYQLLADVLGTPGVTWVNDASHPWPVQKTNAGVTLSGYRDLTLSSGSITSTLRAEFDGPGEFRFDYNFQPWYSTLVFKKDGVTVSTMQQVQTGRKSTSLVFTTSGKTVLEWVYQYSCRDAAYSFLGCEIFNPVWIPHSPPLPVSDVLASNGDYTYGTYLRWTEAAGATSYSIYRGTTDSPSEAMLIGTTDSSHFWDVSGAAGKLYCYWVVASNQYGDGVFSPSVTGRRAGAYTITFDANDGTGTTSLEVVGKGESSMIPPTPFVRTGYNFAGWAQTADGPVVYNEGDDITPISDLTLYARWTPISYTVTLNNQNGSGGSAFVSVPFGSAMPDIALPTRTDYVFGGYWTDPNGEGVQYYTASGASARDWDRPSDDTLYACWIKPLSSIAISGPSAVASAETATYTCTATYGDWSTETVSACWTIPVGDAYASVEKATGVVTSKNEGETDQVATLRATFGGMTADLAITLLGKEPLRPKGDLHVDAEKGDDANDGRTWRRAKKTIQGAIDVAADGNLILVFDGTYGPVDTAGMAIEIRSVNGADATVIDGGGASRCATLLDADADLPLLDESTVLVGFTLRNGLSADDGGGAIGGHLVECVLCDNATEGMGGGAACAGLERCRILRNRATGGGGGAIYCNLSDCLVAENESGATGGGVFGGPGLSAAGCTIVGNVAATRGGGAISCAVTNSIVWGNSAPSSPDIFGCDEWRICSSVVNAGCGSVAADPLFEDPENGDYRLRPESPCLDAGDNDAVRSEVDLDGAVRVQSGLVDMGAYEQLPSWRITFNVSGNGLHVEGAVTGAPEDGTYRVLPTSTPTLEGYVFQGWTLADGTPVESLSNLSGETRSVILYADWAAVYTIKFIASEERSIEGHTGEEFSGEMDDLVCVCGEPVTLPACAFTRRGYACIGWSERREDVLYLNAETVPSFTRIPGAVVTLYANWYNTSTTTFADPVGGHVAGAGARVYSSLQAAIDAAPDGGTVFAFPGTYGPINAAGRRGLSIYSAFAPDVARSESDLSVIDGSGRSSCAVFDVVTGDGGVMLCGFHLAGGSGENGGGAFGGVLYNCLITDCVATGNGGGAYDSILENCRVSSCRASVSGGGAALCYMYGTVIDGCSATDYGGGAALCHIYGSTLYGNSAETGAGVAGSTVHNSIVWENRLYATDKKGVHKLGNYANVGSGKTAIKNAFLYSDSSPKPSGKGNLAKDPLFVDAALGDFRLQTASPVKNKGSAAYLNGWNWDIRRLPRILGTAPDMGAFETPEGTLVPADYDGDGVADSAYFDSATATWVMMRSRDGLLGVQFGARNDIPLAAYFDGDHRADMAVYSATAKAPAFSVLARSWYQYGPYPLGEKGAQPVVADFDGDGYDDLAVFQGNAKKPSFTLSIISGDLDYIRSVVFGTKGAKAVVGDFDGDGLADLGCYTSTASKPVFSVALSKQGWSAAAPLSITLGAKSSEPCCGDFDGDGITDFAAYSGTAKAPLLYRMFSTAKWREVRMLPFGQKGSRAATAYWDGNGVSDAAIEYQGFWWYVTSDWDIAPVPAP